MIRYQIYARNTRSGKTDSWDIIDDPQDFTAVLARRFGDDEGIVFDLHREYDMNESVTIGDLELWFDYDTNTKYEMHSGDPVVDGQDAPWDGAVPVRLPDGSLVWGWPEETGVLFNDDTGEYEYDLPN